MNKNIIKSPILSFRDVIEDDDIVIYHSNSNPEYMTIIKSVNVELIDNNVLFKSKTDEKINDMIHVYPNWCIIGRLNEFPKLSIWNEKNFINPDKLELGFPYYMVLFLDKIPIKVYEVILHDISNSIISVNHNPYIDKLERIKGKKYYKYKDNIYCSLLKSI